MHVVPRKPAPWVLSPGIWHYLEDGESSFLYVNCEQSAAGYSLMIRLNDEEKTEYHGLGWTFLQYLAEKMNYWPSRYSERRVAASVQLAAEQAIKSAGK